MNTIKGITLAFIIIVSGCSNYSQRYSQETHLASTQITQANQYHYLPQNISNNDIHRISKMSSAHKRTVIKVIETAKKNNFKLTSPSSSKQINKISNESLVNRNDVKRILDEASKYFIQEKSDRFNEFYRSNGIAKQPETGGGGPGIKQ